MPRKRHHPEEIVEQLLDVVADARDTRVPEVARNRALSSRSPGPRPRPGMSPPGISQRCVLGVEHSFIRRVRDSTTIPGGSSACLLYTSDLSLIHI